MGKQTGPKKVLKKEKLTPLQKEFLDSLETTEDLGLTLLDIDVKEETIKGWLKSRVLFKERFYKAIHLKERQYKFLQVCKKHMGNLTKSAKAFGISRRTASYWLEKSDTFAAMYYEIEEENKDFGEQCLKDLMKKKNTAAIIFYNKTKNKDRGYTEKQEIEIKSTNTHTFKNMTDEELDAYIALSEADQQKA